MITAAVSLVAQDVVTMTGEILDQRILSDSKSVNVEIDLRFTIRNNLDRPVILVDADGGKYDCSVALYRRSDPLYAQNGVAGGRSDPGDEYREKVRSELDVEHPRTNVAKVLAKDETIVFDEKQSISLSKTAIPYLGRESWATLLAESRLILEITCDVFPDFIDKPDAEKGTFGRTLKERWQPYGSLLLDSLRTQPMELNLLKPPKRIYLEPTFNVQ